jgi:hypothetical protein
VIPVQHEGDVGAAGPGGHAVMRPRQRPRSQRIPNGPPRRGEVRRTRTSSRHRGGIAPRRSRSATFARRAWLGIVGLARPGYARRCTLLFAPRRTRRRARTATYATLIGQPLRSRALRSS